MSNNKMLHHLSIKIMDVIINIKDKLYIWILNQFVAKKDEYYGLKEPSVEWMNIHNKRFWIQPCDEEEVK